MTEPRFKQLCALHTRIPQTPRVVALDEYYEPQYAMWSKMSIAIPLMNTRAIAFFKPTTFTKEQLERLNQLRTARPDSDMVISRFLRKQFPLTPTAVTNSAMLKAYIKKPASEELFFAHFPAIPRPRSDSYGYSRTLLNPLLNAIAPRSTEIVEVGTYNVRNSTHTVLFVRNRLTGDTLWINNEMGAPRKEKTK